MGARINSACRLVMVVQCLPQAIAMAMELLTARMPAPIRRALVWHKAVQTRMAMESATAPMLARVSPVQRIGAAARLPEMPTATASRTRAMPVRVNPVQREQGVVPTAMEIACVIGMMRVRTWQACPAWEVVQTVMETACVTLWIFVPM